LRQVALVKFIIRPAVRADSLAIRSLINEVQINPMNLDWKRFIVAVTSQNELIGSGQIKPHADGLKELASIAVNQSERGDHIAHEIINSLLIRETNRPLYLMCRAKLELFYARFGFHVIELDIMPAYFRRISKIAKIMNRQRTSSDQLIVMQKD
jgi:N-acetylglutamate synthase-like GNAT family acetyltransferase